MSIKVVWSHLGIFSGLRCIILTKWFVASKTVISNLLCWMLLWKLGHTRIRSVLFIGVLIPYSFILFPRTISFFRCSVTITIKLLFSPLRISTSILKLIFSSSELCNLASSSRIFSTYVLFTLDKISFYNEISCI